LDRDGTVIEDKGHLSRPEDVAPLAGAAEALLSLQTAGFRLFVVTNQSGVGRGFFSLEDVQRCNERLTQLMAQHGVRFERFYAAPETPDQPSRGRKPSPQFLFDARDQFALDLPASFLIGDKLSDLQCGWNAGVKKSILVRTGFGRKVEQEMPGLLQAAVIVDDLPAAAKWILGAT
jgi:D-glycero-D-manno-heptose 1,7-bisphosphate phosphatase